MLFPCPFCGPRDETEFHYLGEPKAPPDPAHEISRLPLFNMNPKAASERAPDH